MIGRAKREIQLAENYKEVFNTEVGQLVLADILTQLCVDQFADPRYHNEATYIELNGFHKIADYIRGKINMTEAEYKRIIEAYERATQEPEWPQHPLTQ